ncbi:N-methyl-D-aspartate receptor NMDAR2C subunit [Litoribrevibacter euphylliae]|uniref:N-methyl-D-aspartate receptor NMDAR2C subunit n=1 Tax=Litoribrevibacter euphylliae TaxID=1834034 RepID=A0ABV7HL67_9GAMM
MWQARWQALMTRLGLSENQTTFDALIAAYSEKHRRYHDLSHLAAVLESLDQVEELTSQKDLIELALWFHDAIYKTKSSGNEAKSAQWARTFLTENEANEETINKVVEFIMATEHNYVPVDEDQKLIVDIDLAILGRSEEVYTKYQQDVRQEYAWVPKFIYTRKRRALLTSFLARPRIYSCDVFYEALEANARQNISRELEGLG